MLYSDHAALKDMYFDKQEYIVVVVVASVIC